MTFPTAPPPAPERPRPPHRSDRFFAWVSGLGVARSDGWIGGVAAGIASRLRIDPLIVRGILVVAALFGLPLILLYAVAWSLLPDPEGRIHLRELLRGRFEPAQLGIFAGILLGMLSVTPSAGLFLVERVLNPYSYQTYGPSPFGVFLFVVGLVLVGILLVLIVRAARRTPGGVSAPKSVPEPAPTPVPEPVPIPVPEPVEGPDTSPTDAESLDAWRAQHTAWQQQEQAWRVQQQDADRAARDQARAERQATAAAFAAEAAERRRLRRASNPRAGLAYVATVIGVALVVATAVWLLSPIPSVETAALAVLSAALVFAFGMVMAGVARRRSGLLAFLTAGTLVAGLLTGGVATVGNVRFGDTNLWNSGESSIRQPFGSTSIYLQNLRDVASQPVVLEKGSGYTEIWVNEGVELQLTATVGNNMTVRWQRSELVSKDNWAVSNGSFTGSPRSDGTTVYRETVTSSVDPTNSESTQSMLTVPVTIDQESGNIVVTYWTRPDEEAAK